VSELKPCPFCGCNKIRFVDWCNIEGGSYACVKCGISTEYNQTQEQALVAWNTRAESPELAALREQVKVLRDALEGARIFIVDGLEFWCVERPEPGKQAFDALNGIYRALAQTKPKEGEGC